MNYIKNNIGSDIVRETRYPIYYGFGVYRKISTGEIFVIPFSNLQNVSSEPDFINVATKLV